MENEASECAEQDKHAQAQETCVRCGSFFAPDQSTEISESSLCNDCVNSSEEPPRPVFSSNRPILDRVVGYLGLFWGVYQLVILQSILDHELRFSRLSLGQWTFYGLTLIGPGCLFVAVSLCYLLLRRWARYAMPLIPLIYVLPAIAMMVSGFPAPGLLLLVGGLHLILSLIATVQFYNRRSREAFGVG